MPSRSEGRPPFYGGGRPASGRARLRVAYPPAMPHVIVVGAGPAGASLAFVLADRGVEVTLLERQRDFAREFRGEVLLPSGLEALEQLGLGAALARRSPGAARVARGLPEPPRCCSVSRGGGSDLLRRASCRAPLSQPALLEAIVAAARGRGRGSASCAARPRATSCARAAASSACARPTRTPSVELRADLVVGADGRASVGAAPRGLRGAGAGRADGHRLVQGAALRAAPRRARLPRPRPPPDRVPRVRRPRAGGLGDPEGHLRRAAAPGDRALGARHGRPRDRRPGATPPGVGGRAPPPVPARLPGGPRRPLERARGAARSATPPT